MVIRFLFGMTMSPVAKYLQFARRILVKILKNDAWGTMDGLKCHIEKAPDDIVQSRFYNGWKSEHYVSAVLCFVPDGTIATGF